MEKRNYDMAMKDFDRCIKLNLDVEPCMASQSQCYIIERKLPRAVAVLDKIIVREPNHPEHFFARAECLAQLGKLKEAAADLTQTIKIDRAFPAALIERSKIYEKMGRHDLAQKDLQESRKLSGGLESELFPAK